MKREWRAFEHILDYYTLTSSIYSGLSFENKKNVLHTNNERLSMNPDGVRTCPPPTRLPPPNTRHAITHKFNIAGHEGYLTVGLYEDGSPCELFITMAQEGLTIGGLLDSIAILASQALQHGIPLDVLIRKFIHQRFEPSGHTDNPNIPTTSSIIDYIFRWLDWQFTPSAKTREQTGEHPAPPQVIP